MSISPSTVRIITLVVMIVSWLGMMVPVFPGLNIIWIAALGWGIYTGMEGSGWIFFAILTLLMVLGNFSDNFFVSGKAKKSGASWWSILAGNVAAIIGTILFPPFGGLLFIVLGVLIVEIIRHRNWQKAWETSKEMLFGFGWSIAARLILGAGMIGLWAIWAF